MKTNRNMPDGPPPMEFLRRERPSCGDRGLAFRLGDVGIEIRGLDRGLEARLCDLLAPYRVEEGAGDSLQVRAVREETEFFIDPSATTGTNPVLLACEGRRVRYLGHQVAGWFDTANGSGGMVLATGRYERPERAVENYLRAAVAWQAAERGGALVHAASLVLDGRAYLFFGPSGAGKSTLSACNRRARVVSDDLSLALPATGGGVDLVGTPFRGTAETGAPLVGRFPLAAGFRIVKDDVAEVRSAPRVRLLGELVGNLPFVAEAFGRRPDLFAAAERSFAALPLAHLHFRKDESYWDAILAWESEGT